MPASYVHQCVAQDACDMLSLYTDPRLRSAVLAGSEGPDPFFFSLFSAPGGPVAPKIGALLHKQKTDDFLIALCDTCAHSPITRAYACGFMTHYATDTTFHPFIYAHSLTEDGAYSSTNHCTLEHQLETLHYRRQGHPTGLPMQMAGFAALSNTDLAEIARSLSSAISHVFPNEAMRAARVKKSFTDAVLLCNLLRSESGVKFKALGALLKPFGMDRPLHSHMMPVAPPDTDIANDAHKPWASLWAPDQLRTESFDDLLCAARERAKALIVCADGYMRGEVSYATLRALHGGNSYDSGMSWQTTCPASSAPGVSVRKV